MMERPVIAAASDCAASDRDGMLDERKRRQSTQGSVVVGFFESAPGPRKPEAVSKMRVVVLQKCSRS